MATPLYNYNSFGGVIGPLEEEYNRRQNALRGNQLRWPNGSSTHPNDSWGAGDDDDKYGYGNNQPSGLNWMEEVQRRAEEARQAKELTSQQEDYMTRAMELIRQAQEAARHQRTADQQPVVPVQPPTDQPVQPVQPVQPTGRKLVFD